MSKRTLVLVVMALLLAVTPALAVGLVESDNTPDAGPTYALRLRFGEPIAPLREPTCPDPSNPGGGGG